MEYHFVFSNVILRKSIATNKRFSWVSRAFLRFLTIILTIFNIELTIKRYKSYLIYYRYRIDSKIEKK